MTDRAQLGQAIAMLEAQRVVLGDGASVVAMRLAGMWQDGQGQYR